MCREFCKEDKQSIIDLKTIFAKSWCCTLYSVENIAKQNVSNKEEQ